MRAPSFARQLLPFAHQSRCWILLLAPPSAGHGAARNGQVCRLDSLCGQESNCHLSMAGRMKLLVCALGCCLMASVASAGTVYEGSFSHCWTVSVNGQRYGIASWDNITVIDNIAGERESVATYLIWNSRRVTMIRFPFYGVASSGVIGLGAIAILGFRTITRARVP